MDWVRRGCQSRYNFQLLACDSFITTNTSGLGVGLFLSGFSTTCYKACNNWCSDTTTHYFRTEGTYTACYNGVRFNEIGSTVRIPAV